MLAFETPETPIVYFALSFWTGSAVLISLYIWLRDVGQGITAAGTLKQTVITALARGLTLTILSILFVAVIHTGDLDPVQYWPELALFAVLLTAFSLHVTKGHGDKTKIWLHALLIETFQLTFLTIMIVLLWMLSALLGLAVMYISTILLNTVLGGFIPFQPLRDAVMVVGLIWLLPFVFGFQTAQKKEQAGIITLPEHFKFYKILWPILLAIGLFMIPLLIEHILQKGDLEAMRNIPRPPPFI